MTEYCILKSYNFTDDPFYLFKLFEKEKGVFFLDSCLNDNIRGRYSFIGFDPFAVFCDKGKNSINELRSFYKSYMRPLKKRVPTPFPAGLMGYFSYDFGLKIEDIRLKAHDDLLLPDCLFGFYDCILTVDHFTKKLHISSSGLPEKKEHLAKKKATERMAYIIKKLKAYNFQNRISEPDENTCHPCDSIDIGYSSNFTKQEYLKTIRKALKYIARGDIYQVNLSQRFLFDRKDDFENVEPSDIYLNLRKVSPSGFGGYFDCGDFQIVSNSPERFLNLQGNILKTRPMKGTRPRGGNEAEDRRLKEELLSSRKDKAELLMITDLLRNDLGRVSKYGSVKVKEMRTLEKYATVFQTTSTIEGVLSKGKDFFDVISACYPGGSITGCPKIRAMEIIEELEPTRRSLYTGAMGYFSVSGNMDFNILIRTILATKEKIYYQTGGGIVADSIPECEYEETLVKAEAMRRSLEILHALDVKV